MNIENAISEVKQHRYSPFVRQIDNEVCDLVVSVLEKQMPMMVIHNKMQNVYDCPNCKEYIKEDEYFGYPIGEDENFCKTCGQALKWED